MSLPPDFKGIVPPVCTPFTHDVEIDTASLERFVAYQLDGGVHGLFLLGSSSEAVFLSDRQRRAVLDTAIGAAAGAVPILAGTIDMTTARCIDHALVAEAAGADAIVVTPPFYGRFNQQEIVQHFEMIHDAVDIPIVAYDVPSAVHTEFKADTIAELADRNLIVGLKDSSGNEANFRSLLLRDDLPDSFARFTGSELLVDVALFMGASGSVPGLGNVDPGGYVRIYDSARRGDWQSAKKEQERLFELFSIIYAATPGSMGGTASALGGFKTALMLLGVFETNVPGRPQTPYDDAGVARVREKLEAAGLQPR